MTVPRSRCTMTLGSQTRKEAPDPTGSLVHPKNTLKMGNWNVRTFYRTGNLAQAANCLKRVTLVVNCVKFVPIPIKKG